MYIMIKNLNNMIIIIILKFTAEIINITLHHLMKESLNEDSPILIIIMIIINFNFKFKLIHHVMFDE